MIPDCRHFIQIIVYQNHQLLNPLRLQCQHHPSSLVTTIIIHQEYIDHYQSSTMCRSTNQYCSVFYNYRSNQLMATFPGKAIPVIVGFLVVDVPYVSNPSKVCPICQSGAGNSAASDVCDIFGIFLVISLSPVS